MRKSYLYRRYTFSSKLECCSSSGTCNKVIRLRIPTCPQLCHLPPFCFSHATSVWGISHSLFFARTACHVGSYLPEQGSNPVPLQWERRVLTTGPPGKSLTFFLGEGFPDHPGLHHGVVTFPWLWSWTDRQILIFMSVGLVFSTIFKEVMHLLIFCIPQNVQFIMSCK